MDSPQFTLLTERQHDVSSSGNFEECSYFDANYDFEDSSSSLETPLDAEKLKQLEIELGLHAGGDWWLDPSKDPIELDSFGNLIEGAVYDVEANVRHWLRSVFDENPLFANESYHLLSRLKELAKLNGLVDDSGYDDTEQTNPIPRAGSCSLLRGSFNVENPICLSNMHMNPKLLNMNELTCKQLTTSMYESYSHHQQQQEQHSGSHIARSHLTVDAYNLRSHKPLPHPVKVNDSSPTFGRYNNLPKRSNYDSDNFLSVPRMTPPNQPIDDGKIALTRTYSKDGLNLLKRYDVNGNLSDGKENSLTHSLAVSETRTNPTVDVSKSLEFVRPNSGANFLSTSMISNGVASPLQHSCEKLTNRLNCSVRSTDVFELARQQESCLRYHSGSRSQLNGSNSSLSNSNSQMNILTGSLNLSYASDDGEGQPKFHANKQMLNQSYDIEDRSLMLGARSHPPVDDVNSSTDINPVGTVSKPLNSTFDAKDLRKAYHAPSVSNSLTSDVFELARKQESHLRQHSGSLGGIHNSNSSLPTSNSQPSNLLNSSYASDGDETQRYNHSSARVLNKSYDVTDSLSVQTPLERQDTVVKNTANSRNINEKFAPHVNNGSVDTASRPLNSTFDTNDFEAARTSVIDPDSHTCLSVASSLDTNLQDPVANDVDDLPTPKPSMGMSFKYKISELPPPAVTLPDVTASTDSNVSDRIVSSKLKLPQFSGIPTGSSCSPLMSYKLPTLSTTSRVGAGTRRSIKPLKPVNPPEQRANPSPNSSSKVSSKMSNFNTSKLLATPLSSIAQPTGAAANYPTFVKRNKSRAPIHSDMKPPMQLHHP